ncbi:hypothetical protein [[Eubacterium] cellulosolvens]
MKNAILAGAIAGAVADIAAIASAYVFGNIGVFEPPGGSMEIWTASMFLLLGVAHLALDMIWGMIGGAAYSFLYGTIPGKAAVKGLYFGLSIWVIKDVAAGSYLALTMNEVNSAILLIIGGFFMWIVYGAVIGYLFKK